MDVIQRLPIRLLSRSDDASQRKGMLVDRCSTGACGSLLYIYIFKGFFLAQRGKEAEARVHCASHFFPHSAMHAMLIYETYFDFG